MISRVPRLPASPFVSLTSPPPPLSLFRRIKKQETNIFVSLRFLSFSFFSFSSSPSSFFLPGQHIRRGGGSTFQNVCKRPEHPAHPNTVHPAEKSYPSAPAISRVFLSRLTSPAVRRDNRRRPREIGPRRDTFVERAVPRACRALTQICETVLRLRSDCTAVRPP